LGERVLSKICAAIDEEMNLISAQKCSLSLLQAADLWEKTGRGQLMADEVR
jgi:prolyl-tRNA synthetase